MVWYIRAGLRLRFAYGGLGAGCKNGFIIEEIEGMRYRRDSQLLMLLVMFADRAAVANAMPVTHIYGVETTWRS